MTTAQQIKLATKIQLQSFLAGFIVGYLYVQLSSIEYLGGAIFLGVVVTCLVAHYLVKKHKDILHGTAFMVYDSDNRVAREQIDNLGTHSASIYSSLGKAFESYYHHTRINH